MGDLVYEVLGTEVQPHAAQALEIVNIQQLKRNREPNRTELSQGSNLLIDFLARSFRHQHALL
jgi:hypothetical protein